MASLKAFLEICLHSLWTHEMRRVEARGGVVSALSRGCCSVMADPTPIVSLSLMERLQYRTKDTDH
jgi:hypothetical protein